MNNNQNKATIVYLTTFPPRECGIATFTSDLIDNFDRLYGNQEETKVVAMTIDGSQGHKYPPKVIAEVRQDEVSDYIRVAEMLNNMPEVKLVAIEHEYGIFGKDHGKNLLSFLERIKKPITVTCHTVLPNPASDMKQVMQEIITRADRLIVMTTTSKRILEEVYAAPPEKVAVIPHGIHPVSFTNGSDAKEELGLEGYKIISTFGFLSRGKGVEYGIRAMPEIIKNFPNCLYLIIGETHPVVKGQEGESYRQELKMLARELGVEGQVRFVDKYLATGDLLKFLEATDIYLSLSQNSDQAVSGTLSYALGVGRPVVSTPFAQAREAVTAEVGILIEIGTHAGIVREVSALLGDEERREALARNAYFRTRIMTWPNVILSYMREFAVLAPELAKKEKVVPALKLDHLAHLTDGFGVFQFANLSDPDPRWGYTLDDNARALVVVAWCSNVGHNRMLASRLSKKYLRFIKRASMRGGGFINYFDSGRVPHLERNTLENLEDANARALWALAEAAHSNLPLLTRLRASRILNVHIKTLSDLRSPRAVAFIIKACATILLKRDSDLFRSVLIHQAEFLVKLWEETSNDSWRWFEDIITYSNALLPESLLLAYEVTGDERYRSVGRESLEFLISQSFEDSKLVPVGQGGWLRRGGRKYTHDQQPEEVMALVLSLATAHRITDDPMYEERMEQAFNWFLGNNTLNQMVYSDMTGGSYDGIGEKEINLNQGAESTVSYLLARLAMQSDHRLPSKKYWLN